MEKTVSTTQEPAAKSKQGRETIPDNMTMTEYLCAMFTKSPNDSKTAYLLASHLDKIVLQSAVKYAGDSDIKYLTTLKNSAKSLNSRFRHGNFEYSDFAQDIADLLHDTLAILYEINQNVIMPQKISFYEYFSDFGIGYITKHKNGSDIVCESNCYSFEALKNYENTDNSVNASVCKKIRPIDLVYRKLRKYLRNQVKEYRDKHVTSIDILDILENNENTQDLPSGLIAAAKDAMAKQVNVYLLTNPMNNNITDILQVDALKNVCVLDSDKQYVKTLYNLLVSGYGLYDAAGKMGISRAYADKIRAMWCSRLKDAAPSLVGDSLHGHAPKCVEISKGGEKHVFTSISKAAEYIGVSKQGLSGAIKKDKPCKCWQISMIDHVTAAIDTRAEIVKKPRKYAENLYNLELFENAAAVFVW